MAGSEIKRYQCTLDADILVKACEELNEPKDNTARLLAIDNLRNAFNEKYPDIEVCAEEVQDAFVLRFLRARKFDQDRALVMMKNYLSRRSLWPELFKKVDDPGCLANILDTKLVVALDSSAKDGSSIILFRPGIGGEAMILEDLFACILLSMEKLLQNEDVQVHGITMVEDFQYATMAFAKQLGPLVAKKMLAILQETMPIRLKGINLLNEPMLFDMIFAIVKPFMKEKTKSRMFMIGSEYSLLHERIDPESLPVEYGGLLSEIDYNKWRANLLGLAEDTKM